LQGGKQHYAPDVVTITGSVLGIFSLLPGWFVIRPNRLAEGNPISILGAAGYVPVVILLLLWLACLVLGFFGIKKRGILLAALSNFMLLGFFLLVGYLPGLVSAGQGAEARVSLDAGVWLTVLALYLVIYAAGKKQGLSPLFKNTTYLFGPACFLLLLFSGNFNGLSVMNEFEVQKARFYQEFWHHIYLVAVSLAAGAILGVLIGIWARVSSRVESPLFFLVNIIQTIPSLALFGLLIAPLSAISFQVPFLRDLGIRGIGDAPAIIALTVYSLLPIARNTFTGLCGVDKNVIDAGRGMGMDRWRIFTRIEVPLAAPLIVSGIRTSAVQCVGLAAVAALIGAGGLGWFIFQGLGQAASDLILLGAIPIILLAITTDFVMKLLSRLSRPKGFMESYDPA
jgi:osmoprotectant transport system permease protein